MDMLLLYSLFVKGVTTYAYGRTVEADIPSFGQGNGAICKCRATLQSANVGRQRNLQLPGDVSKAANNI